MATLDWIVVAVFLGGVIVVGLYLSRRASGSMEDYFISGRNLPWWLAGTSILATSFSSDTPLHVTRVIRESGLGGAWFYWNGIISGLLVAFFFARLWRRAGIITDAEFIELRYSGRPAATLRAVIALFRSLVLELITLSWVILGMTKIMRTVLGLPEKLQISLGASAWTVDADVAVVVVLVAVALVYSTTSGLWGVVVTDFIEFFVAMVGAIALAVLAMRQVGGVEGLRAGLASSHLGAGALDILPGPSAVQLPAVALVTFLGIQWWANTEIDGSGKRAQRFLACRDERHALASGIWNMAVQWLLRSWPWYLTAIASVVILPRVADHEAVYPQLIAQLMPVGLKGLMVAAFLAAFLSTIDSQLNLSASYLINDLYRRFWIRDREPAHYVAVSRVAVVLLALCSTALALGIPSVLDAFRFKMELMAGLGLVYLLRWFWWRVSAWTELVALGAGVLTCLLLHLFSPFDPAMIKSEAFAWRLIIIVATSAVLALTCTMILPPEPLSKLEQFYRRVNPPALLWGPVARPQDTPSTITSSTLAQYLLAVVAVFSGMFGLGKLLLGELPVGLALAALFVVTGAVVLRWIFGSQIRPC